MIGTFGKVVMTKPEQIRKYFEVALNTDKPRSATLNSSEALVVDDSTVVIAGFALPAKTSYLSYALGGSLVARPL